VVAGALKHDLDAANQAVDERAADVASSRKLLKKLASKTAVIEAVERWKSNEINWLEELRRLSEHFPPADQAVVQRMSMAPTSGSRGLLSMGVRVRDPAIIAEVEKNVRDEAHQVSSQRISQSGNLDDFSCQFETTAVITPHQGTRLAKPHPKSRLR
jgi:hypothetical protein